MIIARALPMLPVIFLALSGIEAVAEDLMPFQTPSGNIHCLLIRGGGANAVECEIRSMVNAKPALPRPPDCDLDWGSRFALDAKGKAGMVCHGDTIVTPDAPVLAYGKTKSLGGIACKSEPKGLNCRNKAGRGFSLSKSKQTLF